MTKQRFAIVPREADETQQMAAFDGYGVTGSAFIYKTMVEAAPPVPDELVERVARTICEELGYDAEAKVYEATPKGLAVHSDGDGALRGLPATRESFGEWSNDMDAAPRDGTPVWVYIPLGYQTSVVFARGQWRRNVQENVYFYPTHWQPLPPAPDSDEREEG